MKETDYLTTAIIKTLIYSDLFDYPLSRQEIWERLHIDPLVAITPKDIFQVLNDLVKQGHVTRYGQWYALSGREATYAIRANRQKKSQQKWQRVARVSWWLAKVPFILMIAVTGGLAVNNTTDEDDIDLLIVAQANRLWLTRLLVVGLTELLGVRRRPLQKQVADTVCLNMFLEETALAVPRKKQNLYTAYEVLQVHPVVNKQQTYERFLAANADWTSRFLPHANRSIRNKKPPRLSMYRRPKAFRPGDMIETVCYRLQRLYMSRRQGKETVSRQVAFFHPRDTGGEVLAKFRHRCRDHHMIFP